MYNIERLLKRSVQRHLSEDELGAYHDNIVDEVSRARIEAHLGRCQLCERRYAMMQDVLATYTQELLTEAEVKWLQKLLGNKGPLEKLIKLLQEAFACIIFPVPETMQAAGTDDEGQEFQTEDGSIRGYAVREDSGAFVIRLQSDHLRLEDMELLLKAGDFQTPFVFEGVTDDLVGVEIILTPEDLKKIPENPKWAIEPRGESNEPSNV